MFAGLISSFKQKIDATMQSMMWVLIALAAAIAAVCFFCVAAFGWLSVYYGPIMASAILGVAFLVIATIALIVSIVLRRRSEARRRLAAEQAKTQWWLDPALVATGLEIGKVLGARRLMSLAALAAVIMGVAMMRPVAKAPPEEGTED